MPITRKSKSSLLRRYDFASGVGGVRLQMDIQCLMFDLDGTLVDSENLNCRGFTELLPWLNEDATSLAARYRGMKFSNIVLDIEKRYAVEIGKEFESRYRKHVAKLFDEALEPNPGFGELLERLTLDVCVASSAPRQKIEHALTVSGLSQYFGSNIFSSYEVGSWKPEPKLFLHAAVAMGVEPANCAVVEDSDPGIAAAKAAGMSVIHYQPHELPQVAGGCFRINNALQIETLLDERTHAI